MKFFAIFAFLFLPTLAVAADNEGASSAPNIAVVDVQKLMSESKAAKSIQKQGQELQKKYQKQIKKIEDDLKKTEKKLVELSKGDSKEDFDKKKKEFQEKLIDGQKEVKELNQKLDKALSIALKELRDEIVDIVSEISEDNKFDMVVARNNVVIVAKRLDITSDVMDKLNDDLSSVKVKD